MAFRSLILACVAAVPLLACHHDWGEANQFADDIRCGMNETQIGELVKRYGKSPQNVWKQDANVLTVKPGELDFVDILLQGGKAVAVQRGNYVALTTGIEFGKIRMLCGAAPITDRTLFDYERRQSRVGRNIVGQWTSEPFQTQTSWITETICFSPHGKYTLTTHTEAGPKESSGTYTSTDNDVTFTWSEGQATEQIRWDADVLVLIAGERAVVQGEVRRYHRDANHC